MAFFVYYNEKYYIYKNQLFFLEIVENLGILILLKLI